MFDDVWQHCVFEFLDALFDRIHAQEIGHGRYGLWGGVQLGVPAATHVDRLFGFVRETRRRCIACRQPVLAWFSSERILRVWPKNEPGGPQTMSELYLSSCLELKEKRFCDSCGRNTKQQSQSRMMSVPNVLVCKYAVDPKTG